MNFNPIKFLESRGEQSALKSVIEKKLKDFEYNLSYAKIDWKKRPNERFIGMKENELAELQRAVGTLGGYAKDIKTDFNLSEGVRKTLDEIEKITQSISDVSDLESMKKSFTERGIGRFDKEAGKNPYVIEPMASKIDSEMHHLYMQIHKLKRAKFDSILSSKLKTE